MAQSEVITGWDSSLDPTTAPIRKENFVPRGVYDRSKAKPRSNGKSSSEKKGRRIAGQPQIMSENGKYFCGKCGFEAGEDKKLLIKHIRSEHPKRERRKENNDRREQIKEESIENHASYIFGKVETIIEYYANSNGVSKSALAERVASLLRH